MADQDAFNLLSNAEVLAMLQARILFLENQIVLHRRQIDQMLVRGEAMEDELRQALRQVQTEIEGATEEPTMSGGAQGLPGTQSSADQPLPATDGTLTMGSNQFIERIGDTQLDGEQQKIGDPLSRDIDDDLQQITYCLLVEIIKSRDRLEEVQNKFKETLRKQGAQEYTTSVL